MENLPNEIILQQLEKMSHQDLLNTCKTNKRINQICKDNEDYLYKKLIKREFFDNINPKFLYNLFLFNKKKGVDLFDKSKHFNLYKSAILNNNINQISYLYNIGVSINAVDNKGMTPLMYSLRNYGTPEIINKILDLNPYINAVDISGMTPLIFSLVYSTPEIINRILDLQVDINVVNKRGNTPLMFALQTSTQQIINRILDLNPDINVVDKHGDTALMFALQFSTPEIINRILDLNFDINVVDKYGDTPLTIALKYSTPEIINRILDLKPKFNAKDSLKIYKDNPNTSQDIINRLNQKQ